MRTYDGENDLSEDVVAVVTEYKTCGLCNGRGRTGWWIFSKQCVRCLGSGKERVHPLDVIHQKSADQPKRTT